MSIAASSASVMLSWSGFSNAVAIQASGDIKNWTNATAPVPGNSFYLTNYAPALNYRLKEATNQIDLGKEWLDNYYITTNGAGQSTVITHDFNACYMTLYGRDKSLASYTIPDLIPQDFNYGCECAWQAAHLIVAFIPSYTNRLFVDEFAVTPTAMTLVNELMTGDDDSRSPDVFRMSDGTVAICTTEHCGGLESWIVHRKPNGGWVDDGRQVFIPCGPSEAAGQQRMAEAPWDHSLIIGCIHDGSHVLQVVQAQFLGINSRFTIVTNFTLASSDDDSSIAPHGEIPGCFKVIGDAVGNCVTFVYQNEQRSFIPVTNIDYVFSLAHLAVTAMHPDYSKSLRFITPGSVERVDANYAINFSNGVPIITYPPLDASYLTNWPPIVPATRLVNGTESQEMYLNIYDLAENRGYRDIVGVRDDQHIIVILEP